MEKKKKDVPSQMAEEMSVEQLKQLVDQLSEQNNMLYRQCQTNNMNNLFKRLEYLFKVVELADRFHSEFVNSAVSEIEELLTIEDTPQEKSNPNVN